MPQRCPVPSLLNITIKDITKRLINGLTNHLYAGKCDVKNHNSVESISCSYIQKLRSWLYSNTPKVCVEQIFYNLQRGTNNLQADELFATAFMLLFNNSFIEFDNTSFPKPLLNAEMVLKQMLSYGENIIELNLSNCSVCSGVDEFEIALVRMQSLRVLTFKCGIDADSFAAAVGKSCRNLTELYMKEAFSLTYFGYGTLCFKGFPFDTAPNDICFTLEIADIENYDIRNTYKGMLLLLQNMVKLKSLGQFKDFKEIIQLARMVNQPFHKTLTSIQDFEMGLDTLEYVATHFNNVTEICLDEPSEEILNELHILPKVTSFTCDTLVVGNWLLTYLRKHGKKLKKLAVLFSFCTHELGIIDTLCPNLIEFTYGREIGGVIFKKGKFINLTKFIFIGDPGCKPAFVNLIGTMKNLKHLEIDFYNNDRFFFTDEDIYQIIGLNSFSNLEFFRSRDIDKKVCCDCILDLIDHCPKLMYFGSFCRRTDYLTYVERMSMKNMNVMFVNNCENTNNYFIKNKIVWPEFLGHIWT